jgi:predicted N-acetyltransferase YhbS
LKIRKETAADIENVSAVTLSAFSDHPISNQTKPYIIHALRAAGALVGDLSYSRRFGFRNYPAMIHEGIPQEVFLALPLIDEVPQGIVGFHDGFQATS